MKAKNIFKALFIAPFLFLIGGTVWGKASFFKFAKSSRVGPWLLLELSAADREILRSLAESILKIPDQIERHQSWMYMKMQVIASCAVNKRGWYLYDPRERRHLDQVSEFPDRVIEEALIAIHSLSDMPWLISEDDKRADTENP